VGEGESTRWDRRAGWHGCLFKGCEERYRDWGGKRVFCGTRTCQQGLRTWRRVKEAEEGAAPRFGWSESYESLTCDRCGATTSCRSPRQLYCGRCRPEVQREQARRRQRRRRERPEVRRAHVEAEQRRRARRREERARKPEAGRRPHGRAQRRSAPRLHEPGRGRLGRPSTGPEPGRRSTADRAPGRDGEAGPAKGPERGHAFRSLCQSARTCDRPGCYRPSRTSARGLGAYCGPGCALAVRRVLDRQRKWRVRGTEAGRLKRMLLEQRRTVSGAATRAAYEISAGPRSPP